MVTASELRSAATEYTEAEYQLSKFVSKKVPVGQPAITLFFVELDRREGRVRAVSESN